MGVLDRLGFGKLKDVLAKTREGLVGNVTRLVMSRATIDDDIIEHLEEILIGADVGVEATTQVIDAIRRRVREERYTETSELNRLLREEIQRQFAGGNDAFEQDPFLLPAEAPYVIMVVGINGVGKTTTIGKLAFEYIQRGKKVFIGAADTYRAAANEQLAIWAERAGATLIQLQRGSDPAAVAYDAVHSAATQGADVAIHPTNHHAIKQA